MFQKIKNTGWLLPVGWLAVLYVWCGTLYPFLFSSHDLEETEGPAPWLSVVYAVLLLAGILLFREKPLFRGIFIACRLLQTAALLLLLLVPDHWITLTAALLIIPYIGLFRFQLIWVQIILTLFSLAMTIISIIKPKK